MTTPMRLLKLFLVAPLALPLTLAAQQVDPSLGAARALGSATTSDLTAIAPAVAFTAPWWRASTEWSTIASGARTTTLGLVSAALLGPHIGPFRSEFAGDFQTRSGDLPADARLAARLHLAGPARGLWLGSGIARTFENDAWLRSAGGWMQGRLGALSIRFDQTVGNASPIAGAIIDTLHPAASSLRSQSLMARYSTPSGRVEFALGAASASGSLPRVRHGTTGVATWWVGRTFALVGGYGPSVGNGLIPTAGAARFGVVWRPFRGVRQTWSLVEPAAIAVATVERVGEGEWRIRLPASGAHVVEVEGSFGDWEPVAMHEAEPGWWEVTIPLTTGRHELTWRRDQATWGPLPGLPTVNDDLLGKVSVIVID